MDWNKEHEQKFFDSLQSQTIKTKTILIDYNSKQEYSDWLLKLASKYDFIKVIKIEGDEKFRKSYALNVGFQNSKSDFVLFTDIDCILSPNVTEECLKILTQTPDSMVVSEKIKTSPRGVPIGKYSGSIGGMIAVSSEWLRKVRGFDEWCIGYWAVEDIDIVHRARLDRLKVINIYERVRILHQFHKIRCGTREEYFKKRKHYFNERSIIRNLEKWGREI